jgi:hypothetical protein
MPISWNEIRQNAIRFSREWAEEHREDAEAKTFWDEFFAVFGMRRRTLASFEDPVLRSNGSYGYIDLFWRGVLLVEHKSRGKSLDKAESQAFNYIQDLARQQRREDLPRYVILSDFDRIALYDLEPDEQPDLPLFDARHYRKIEFPLAELHKRIQEFAFIAGYKQHRIRDVDPINIKAVEILGDLHDALAAGGYSGHDSNASWSASSSAFSPKTPASSNPNPSALPREPHRGGRLRPRPASRAPLRRAEHPARKTPEEPRRTLAAFPTSTANSLPRISASPTSTATCATRCCLHALRLVAHLTRHFRLALPGRHGTQGAPPDRRALHQRTRHPQGHRSLFLDDLRAEFERAKSSKAEC